MSSEASDELPLLAVRNVSKWFGPDPLGPPVLRDISLDIPPRGWTVIVGPSGSGKTTLLSLLGALDRPSEGQVLFRGQDLARFSDIALARVRREIAFVFQEHSLVERLPLWENVTYPLVPRGWKKSARRELAGETLARLGLAGFEEKPPEELSGGERQRAAVARALVSQPVALLADEPTASLDPESSALVREAFQQAHAAGATIVVATHDPDLAALASQRLRLQQGAIVPPDRV